MSNSRVYFDGDADLNWITGSTVAILGYGAQGRAHALNLRDSGCKVVVGQRAGAGLDQAIRDGFDPVSIEQATQQSDVVNLLLPDELHGELFAQRIAPHLRPGMTVMCCHGFSMHYGMVKLPTRVAGVLVAPKGAAHMVRSAYEQGGGVPALLAMGENADEKTLRIGLGYAKALGATRVGVFETTIAEETETDLFGEQVVLCGGVSHLIQAAFETLVEAGYQPALAYFECLWELKLVVDLLHRGGLAYMRDHISNTAEYGDYSRGPRIVSDQVRQTMREILQEIRSGQFADEFLSATQRASGEQTSKLQSYRQQHAAHPIELARQQIIEQLGQMPVASAASRPSANPR